MPGDCGRGMVKKKGKSPSQMSRAPLPNYLFASLFPVYHAANNDKQRTMQKFAIKREHKRLPCLRRCEGDVNRGERRQTTRTPKKQSRKEKKQ
jgi:hypothetical protein